MENSNAIKKKGGANWRLRFVITITLANALIWFLVIPPSIGVELRDPWFWAFYYFGGPALWLFFSWQFLDS